MLNNPKILYMFKIFGIPVIITNFTISLCFYLFILLSFHLLYNKSKIITFVLNKITEFIDNMCDNFLEHKKSFTILFSFFFLSILIWNLMGSFSFYSISSMFLVPITLTIIIFISSFFYGLYNKKMHVFIDLVPSNMPLIMKILLFPIELLSVLIKPLSLFIRLFANITIGHMVLHILENIANVTGPIFLPVVAIVNIIEIGTGVLQSYLFTLFGILLAGYFVKSEH